MKSIKTTFILIIFIFSLMVLCSCGSKPKFKGGDLKSHMSDFSEPMKYNEESQIVDSYFKNVSYSVVKTDADNKIITFDVTVPDFVTILKATIDENYNGNNTEDYDALLESVKDKFNDKLNDPSHPTLNKQITLSIEKDENEEWKIVPSEELYDFISDPIYQAIIK